MPAGLDRPTLEAWLSRLATDAAGHAARRICSPEQDHAAAATEQQIAAAREKLARLDEAAYRATDDIGALDTAPVHRLHVRHAWRFGGWRMITDRLHRTWARAKAASLASGRTRTR
jgi:hypothetical protein